jgi:hypothetical protein
MNCWKWCFLCGPRWGYIRKPTGVFSWERMELFPGSTSGLDWIKWFERNMCWTEWFLWTSLYIMCSWPTPIWRKWYRWSLPPGHSCVQYCAKQHKGRVIQSSTWPYTELQLPKLAMSGPAASDPLDVCGAVVATCIGNAPKRRIQNLCWVATIAS